MKAANHRHGPGNGGSRFGGGVRALRALVLAGGVVLGACGLAEPRKVAQECSNAGDYRGADGPFHTVALEPGLQFAADERFRTGADAYEAFATWDECTLYLGFAGPALGGGQCSDPDLPGCSVAELGGSSFRFLVFYLDTDPLGRQGTRDALALGELDWQLPIRADYLVVVRTDGRVEARGDSLAFIGNVRVYRWTPIWSTSVERTWAPADAGLVQVGGEPDGRSLVVAVDLAAIGSPCAVQALGWIVDTEHAASFAYWPAALQSRSVEAASSADPSAGQAPKRTQSARALGHYYGFVLSDSVVPVSRLNLDRLSYPGCED